jgi:hypothetical protein
MIRREMRNKTQLVSRAGIHKTKGDHSEAPEMGAARNARTYAAKRFDLRGIFLLSDRKCVQQKNWEPFERSAGF